MGLIDTLYSDESTKKIMRTFSKAFRKTCKKHDGDWIGEGAMQYLKAGNRLTGAVQSQHTVAIPVD